MKATDAEKVRFLIETKTGITIPSLLGDLNSTCPAYDVVTIDAYLS